jgi:hypothetical protein
MFKRLIFMAMAGLIGPMVETAHAVNLLANGELEVPPVIGWDILESVTGMPGAGVDSASTIGFAHHPVSGSTGLGLFLKPWSGNIGTYLNQDKMVNASLTQTVAGVAGETYTFTGWSKFEPNYSGGVDNRDADKMAPPDTAGPPSPTDTLFLLEFLDSDDNPIGGSTVTLDVKADRIEQIGLPLANDNNWYQHTLSGPAPVGTTSVRVTSSMIDGVFNTDPTQSAFVDDFSLRRSGAVGTELLTNPGLDDTVGVTEWTTTRSPNNFTGDIAVQSFANHTPGGGGGLWMKPFATEGPVGSVLISQTVPGVENGEYSFSGWSKLEANYIDTVGGPAETIMSIEFLDDEDEVLDSETLDVRTAGQLLDATWRQYTINATSPVGTESVRVIAGANMMANNEAGGAQSAFWDDLVLELAEAGQPGDHNGDGKVDQADYVAWRKIPSLFGGDPTGYNTWRENFGEPAMGSAGSGAVPEPASGTLAIVVLLCLAASSRMRV